MSLAQHIIIDRELNGGSQIIYRFPNGYGASVVRSQYTYGGDKGLFELAVLTFDGNGNWHLTYETPITNDVLGHLSVSDVDFQLDQIAALSSQVTK